MKAESMLLIGALGIAGFYFLNRGLNQGIIQEGRTDRVETRQDAITDRVYLRQTGRTTRQENRQEFIKDLFTDTEPNILPNLIFPLPKLAGNIIVNSLTAPTQIKNSKVGKGIKVLGFGVGKTIGNMLYKPKTIPQITKFNINPTQPLLRYGILSSPLKF